MMPAAGFYFIAVLLSFVGLVGALALFAVPAAVGAGLVLAEVPLWLFGVAPALDRAVSS